jgi:phenol/toluene 2-monooxygenase (NADH) P2/A2
MSVVFIVLQANDTSRPIVNAIMADNPHAQLEEQPALIKINAEGHLVIKRETVEAEIGREFDLQELHLSLITLAGNIDETDDEFTLSWGR